MAQWLPSAAGAYAAGGSRADSLGPVRVRSGSAAEVVELAWRSPGAAVRLAAELPAQACSPDPTRLAGVVGASSTGAPQAGGASWLPFARVMESPRPVAGDGTRGVPARMAVDQPALAAVGCGLTRPVLGVGPLASGLAPDSAGVGSQLTQFRGDPDRPRADSDQTVEAAVRVALSRVPEFRRNPVPFLPVTVPDPFELLNALELRRPPPDAERPVSIMGTRPGL